MLTSQPFCFQFLQLSPILLHYMAPVSLILWHIKSMFSESSTFSKKNLPFSRKISRNFTLAHQGRSWNYGRSNEKMEDFSLKMYCSQNILTLTFFFWKISAFCIIDSDLFYDFHENFQYLIWCCHFLVRYVYNITLCGG